MSAGRAAGFFPNGGSIGALFSSADGSLYVAGAVPAPSCKQLGVAKLSPNGTPEAGHDVELVNFTKTDDPSELRLSRFAFNCRQGEQAWDPDGTPQCKGETEQAFAASMRGINRPTTLRFGPDGAAYLVDYVAVRDPGGSDPDSMNAWLYAALPIMTTGAGIGFAVGGPIGAGVGIVVGLATTIAAACYAPPISDW